MIKCTPCAQQISVPLGSVVSTTNATLSLATTGARRGVRQRVVMPTLGWDAVECATIWSLDSKLVRLTFDKFCCVVQKCDHLVGKTVSETWREL